MDFSGMAVYLTAGTKAQCTLLRHKILSVVAGKNHLSLAPER